MNASKWYLVPVLGLALSGSSVARASDLAPPALLATGPVASGAYCPSCNSGVGSYVSGIGTCKSCGSSACGSTSLRSMIHNANKKPQPYVVNLCPGACFGYFQTQWRKWDEVCPYPYQGTGLSDAPRPATPYLPSASDRLPKADGKDMKGGSLPDPRPLDPKKGTTEPPKKIGDVPLPIPLPGGKF